MSFPTSEDALHFSGLKHFPLFSMTVTTGSILFKLQRFDHLFCRHVPLLHPSSTLTEHCCYPGLTHIKEILGQAPKLKLQVEGNVLSRDNVNISHRAPKPGVGDERNDLGMLQQDFWGGNETNPAIVTSHGQEHRTNGRTLLSGRARS